MKQYNYFQALILAFFSRPLYRDVGQNWRGIGLLYLLFLVFLTSLPVIYYYKVVSQNFVADLEPMFAQLPIVTINNGTVTVDVPTPHYIKNPNQNNNIVAIIDTTGKVTDLKNTTASVLLTQHQLIIKEGEDSTRVYDFSSLHHQGVYPPEKVKTFFHYMSYIGVGVAYGITVFLQLLLAIIAMFFFAAFAQLLTHTNLAYKTICRLAAVSLTPAHLLAAVLVLFHWTIPWSWLIYLALSIIYLLFAIEANKPTTPISTDVSTNNP